MRVITGIFFAWSFALLNWGTASGAMIDAVNHEIQQRLQGDVVAGSLQVDHIVLHAPQSLPRFYKERAYSPAWLIDGNLSPDASVLLEVIARADEEGLSPDKYHFTAIKESLTSAKGVEALTAGQLADLDLLLSDAFLSYGAQLRSGRSSGRAATHGAGLRVRSRDMVAVLQDALGRHQVRTALEALRPAHPGYERLRQALALYRSLAQLGGWPGVSGESKLVLGSRGPRVKQLRDRLRVTGELVTDENSGDSAVEEAARIQDSGSLEVQLSDANSGDRRDQKYGDEYFFDEPLLEAVKRFQARHGLQVDGVVGRRTLAALNVPVGERVRQIELNMERLRWLPDSLGDRYILVNIPEFRLHVVEGEQAILDAEAIVGQAKRPTPVLSGTMSYLVMSPRWYVPYSIAVKDKLPTLRQDAYALFRQGIHVFDSNGQEVDPGNINWHGVSRGNFPYRLRQEPGARNALGRIKFMFPNPHQVYLHDTPQTYLFERSERTFSSGCVRISKPIELAEYLLKEDPRWNRRQIVSVSKGRKNASFR